MTLRATNGQRPAGTEQTPAALAFEAVRKHYGPVAGVDTLDLAIPAGELVTLIDYQAPREEALEKMRRALTS